MMEIHHERRRTRVTASRVRHTRQSVSQKMSPTACRTIARYERHDKAGIERSTSRRHTSSAPVATTRLTA